MLYQIDNTRIFIDFNNGIHVKVFGPDNFYYIEVVEYVKGDSFPRIVESYHTHSYPEKTDGPTDFFLPINFFFDFEILVYKVVEGYGLKKIFTHRYNDTGKPVKFIIEPRNLAEGYSWFKTINKYCKLNSCKKIIESSFAELEKLTDNHFFSKEISPYKTYRIGRFPKNSTDFRTIDPRKEGLIWFGNWKTFWSYEHPRSWNFINSEDIVNDILGFN